MVGAGFRILLASGRAFVAANHLTTSRRNSDGVPILSFMSEGVHWRVEASLVKAVTWCPVALPVCADCGHNFAGDVWAPQALDRPAPQEDTHEGSKEEHA